MARRILNRASRTLGLSLAVLGFAAAPAAAAPSFDVEIANDAHEVQRVIVYANSGQYKLRFEGNTTPDLAVTSSAAEVDAALNSLPSINAGGGSVSVAAVGKHRVITFDGGPLASTDVPPIAKVPGNTPLSGGAGVVFVSTIFPGGVARNDERVDYEVQVENTAADAPVSAGDALTCHPDNWTGAGAPAFSFEWLRNGMPIGGATSSTYTTVAPDDEGAAIQCRVIATNTVADASDPGDFVGSTRVTTAVIVDPQPATAPPTPPTSIAIPAQTGNLNGTADRELTCNAGSWSGTPESFTYRWYRNGVQLGAPVGPTAETSTKLTVTAAEQSPPAAFQCAVTATNPGGSQSKASGNRTTANPLAPNPAAPNNNNTLFVTKPNETSGPVTVEVELPIGEEGFVHDGAEPAGGSATGGTGWSCAKFPAAPGVPAKAACTRADPLAPGASYPPINVAARLGADAPGHAVTTATVSGGGGVPASDADEFDFDPARPFEFEAFDSEVVDVDGNDYTQAGGHPFSGYITAAFSTRTKTFGKLPIPVKQPRGVIADLPRGFVGNALSVPELCPGIAEVLASSCPPGSAVGEIDVDIVINADWGSISMPLFAIEPEHGAPVQLAFAEVGNTDSVFTLTPRLRPEDGYAISIESTPAPAGFALRSINRAGFCSYGAKVSGNDFEGCKTADDPNANPVPLITNPTRCTGAQPRVRINVDSWQSPGEFASSDSLDPLPTGCEKVDFTPEISLTPTNNQADTPTGLDVEITMPTEGLEGKNPDGTRNPAATSQANLNNVEVTLPEGMSVNPAAAHGLASCSPGQVKLGSNALHSCPLSSQVGTVEIETPLIQETLTGHVFMADQRNNPFDETIGLYMVFESEKDGITIKIAGKVEADPVTGQLTSTFEENPEQPFSRAVIKFNSGPRAPLINPPTCGTYAIHSELSPWSAVDPANPIAEEIVEKDSVYQVSSGPNGAPCPPNNLEPSLETGLQAPVAGTKSPFVLKLSRDDGTRRFTALDVDMPRGLVAYLKGVPYCPDPVLAGISGAELTGRGELASPACPAASQIGTVQAGAGAGPFPFYAPGRVYLAGPYKGGPLSLAVVTPAVAGPFDLGNVVVRNAIYVDPITAEVNVVSDPIPTILHGLKLAVRDIRVLIDRPGFTAAPTSCEPQEVGVRVGGEGGSSVKLSNRFQVGECAHLGFRPRTRIQLFGKTRRGAYQGVKAVVRPRPGHANISRSVIRFPRSAFVAQEHIRTICTRVQFAAEACPKGSIYGRAIAYSPLLDMPLRGNVYLRSSDNALPDAVADLRGPAHQPIKIEVAIRNDSVRGALRNTVLAAPDAPVSYFRLQMFGKRKGLIVNSRNVCRGKNNATVVMKGHNGKRSIDRTRVFNRRCKKQRRAKRGAHRSKLRMVRASRAPGLSR